MIQRIKKNLVKISCNVCERSLSIYVFSKREIYCKTCTNLLVKPTGNRCKILGRLSSKDAQSEDN